MGAVDEPSQVEELTAAVDELAATFTEVWGRAHQIPRSPISLTQLRALFIVEREGSVNISGLAAELEASLPSASRLCDRLQAGGLLVRAAPGDDRRETWLRVSREGQALVDRVRRARREDLRRVLAAMPAAARTALLTGLAHFQAATAEGRRQATGSPSSIMGRPA
ncbi:MarR family winged helix-turn-helix transcriptional regulator [Actinomadura scrupuli]|uniref:MarR family winged helix-turn-helix transcriptional regulator n=1 Tax=Actinomadura scrupuli TaxID=559629 RepID=UPI003D96673D